jgi:hypothetical protein
MRIPPQQGLCGGLRRQQLRDLGDIDDVLYIVDQHDGGINVL